MSSVLTSNSNMSVLRLFFKLCELLPKWCVLARTHHFSVCLYISPNMKLLLAPLNVTYQELFLLIVCDINNKECMVHRCPNCPKSNTLLQNVLFHSIGAFVVVDNNDDDDDEYIC